MDFSNLMRNHALVNVKKHGGKKSVMIWNKSISNQIVFFQQDCEERKVHTNLILESLKRSA